MTGLQSQHADEVQAGDRFAFGKNWSHFLSVLNEQRIQQAEQSLQAMLAVETLQEKTFLDVGSGSGLFSLAARRLHATVSSFDYDPESVACTQELKKRYFHNDSAWTIEQASVLDQDFLKQLGQFDIVYSWGVLHHTGDMWQALENVVPLIAPGGQLVLALYNDQGGASRRWRMLKRIYNQLPGMLRPTYAFLVLAPRELKFLLLETLKGKPWNYFRNIIHYSEQSARGMSYWHDLIDWMGGYPFEVARPEQIFQFYKQRGLQLQQLKTAGGSLACNEFVFMRDQQS